MHACFLASLGSHTQNSSVDRHRCRSQPTGVACKSIQAQIHEFIAAIDSNKIPINCLWPDIELEDESDPGAECNGWQLGASGNEALAIKVTGWKGDLYQCVSLFPR